jgi:flagellar biosynthesis/type III secretory pathway chaperone
LVLRLRRIRELDGRSMTFYIRQALLTFLERKEAQYEEQIAKLAEQAPTIVTQLRMAERQRLLAEGEANTRDQHERP